MSKPAKPASNGQLKSIVERVERLEETRREIGGDIRDIYTEAKGNGYKPKLLRKIVAERRADAAEKAAEDAELDVYRHALGMAVDSVRSGDLSLREAERAHGVSKSSIHRALAVPVEMTEGDLGKPVSEEPPRPAVAGADECHLAGADADLTGNRHSKPTDAAPQDEAALEPRWTCPLRGERLSCDGHEMQTIPPMDRPMIACTASSCPHTIKAQAGPPVDWDDIAQTGSSLAERFSEKRRSAVPA